MDTDLALLSRYHRHGDAAAFGVLVRDHAGMVFATARRVTRDAALAEDVAQETFLELARHGLGDGMGSVAAWLHRVAWRKACNAIRGEARRRVHEQAAAETLHVGHEATWADLEPLVDAALEELPAHLREPLMAHYLEGCTQQDLAARLGVSQSTVSRQLDAALVELRSRLRVQGPLGGERLAMLLGASTTQAVPQRLTTSLGKMAISWAGGGAGVSTGPAFAFATTLTAMNATKILLALAVTAALVGVPLAMRAPKVSSIKPSHPPVTAIAPAPKSSNPIEEPRHYRPPPVSDAVRQKVDAIIRRHRGMTPKQLRQSPEFNQLMDRVVALLGAPETQRKIEDAVAAIRAMKGTQHGTLQMDLELDDPRGRAWLEAAITNDPDRLTAWVLNRLDGAIFDFAYDPTLERTPGGVSVRPQKEKAPPVHQGDED